MSVSRTLALLLLLAAGWGCRVDTVPPQQAEADRVSAKYGVYFAVLKAEERALFNELEDDSAREIFLQERGADVKLMLRSKLRQGMRRNQVRRVLGSPLDEERTFDAGQLREFWTYRRPNPVGDTLFTVRFTGGRLTGWEVKTTAGY